MPKTKSKANNTFSNSPYHFHDCPICQTMSKAEKTGHSLSLKELRQAFAKVNGKKADNFKIKK